MIIQPVTSPGGINAWLVEDYTLPMFTMRYAFEGGSAQDPAGKSGLANFVALRLGQSAGNLTSTTFQQRIDELAVRLYFRPTKDAVIGGIEALTENRDAAGHLLKLALTEPLFDADGVEEGRRRFLDFHAGEARMPAVVADALWDAVAFDGHPYARPVFGTEAAIATITAADLEVYCGRTFARDRLKVVAVGDISAYELGKFLDDVFGDLPATAELGPVPTTSPALGGRLRVVDMDVSQSAVAFGMGAVPYDDRGYAAASLVHHIIGGPGLSSRLAEEVRNKHGLAFSARTKLELYRCASVFRGRVATRNELVSQSLDVIREELQKMSNGELTQADLEIAKGYLIGSDPLRFDAHAKIAEELLRQFFIGSAPELFESRKSMIEAVTLDDLKSVAARMFDPRNLIVAIAGSPALQPARTE